MKSKVLILVGLLCIFCLGAQLVYANSNGNGNGHGHGHHDGGGSSSESDSESYAESDSESYAESYSDSESDSESYSDSSSRSDSESYAEGGNSRSQVGDVTSTVGDATSESGSNVGDTTATAGDSTASATTGSTESNASNGNINIGGDTIKVKSYRYVAPSLRPTPDTEVIQAHTIFGGVSLANTEAAAKIRNELTLIMQLVEADLMTKTVARGQVTKLFKTLVDASEAQRLLGVLYRCNGKSVLTGFGVLCN